MKKIILSVAAICMMAVSTVSAQDFTYGVKVGLNLANLSGYETGDDEKNKSRLGFAVGVTGEYSLSDKMSVSAELLYSAQGDKITYEDSGDIDGYSYSEEGKEKYNLSYLNIPILYGYKVMDKLTVKAGIQLGFLLSAKNVEKYECTFDGETEKYDEEYDIKSGCNSIDFAIPVGVAYDLTEKIAVDLRYNIGMSSIYDGYTSKNNVLQLSVGYKF
ncbi:MAG: porin family protein [Rikenellaceae bacterium]